MAAPFCPFAEAAAASPRALPVRTVPDPALAPTDAALGRDAAAPGPALPDPVRELPDAAFGALGSKSLLVSPDAAFGALGSKSVLVSPDAAFAVLVAVFAVPVFAVPVLAGPVLAVLAFAGPVLAPDAGRAELCVTRAVPLAAAVAPAAGTGSVVQFRNMKYCWPSVHTFVATQYSTSPYC